MTRLARASWLALAYNLGVIAWGAYVRATGSGAGCGSHWPLCNGEVIPRAAAVETLVEFSHRATSGLALISVVVLFFWARRVAQPGHPVRTGALLSLVFMISEALLGAGLVLFGLVGDDASGIRAVVVSAHLLNTFLLLASMTLTVWWASGGGVLRVTGRQGRQGRQGDRARLVAGVLAILLVSCSGAVTALGDTLFPNASLLEGLAADLSPTAHVLIRLRTIHPVLAVMTALYLAPSVWRFADRRPLDRPVAHVLIALLGTQLALGFLNVLLLAPVWLQLVHLLVADALWIAYVLLAADILASPTVVAAAPTARTWHTAAIADGQSKPSGHAGLR